MTMMTMLQCTVTMLHLLALQLTVEATRADHLAHVEVMLLVQQAVVLQVHIEVEVSMEVHPLVTKEVLQGVDPLREVQLTHITVASKAVHITVDQ